MIATLYQPTGVFYQISASNLFLANTEGYAQVTPEVAEALDCRLEAVDVLSTGPNHVAYSIFDNEGEINYAATVALREITGEVFSIEEEDEVLRGNVLVVQRS